MHLSIGPLLADRLGEGVDKLFLLGHVLFRWLQRLVEREQARREGVDVVAAFRRWPASSTLQAWNLIRPRRDLRRDEQKQMPAFQKM